MRSRLSSLVSLFPLILFLSIPILLFSCNSDEFIDSDGDDDVCNFDSDCSDSEGNKVCANGECVDVSQSNCTNEDVCIKDSDCSAGLFCNDECLCSGNIADGDKEPDGDGENVSDGDNDGVADGDNDQTATCPSIVAEPKLDFGAVNINETMTQTLNIYNSCEDNLTITAMEFVGDSDEFRFTHDFTLPHTIYGSSEDFKVDISYTPKDIGADEVQLIITSDGNPAKYTVTLSSQYKGSVKISATPNPLEFKEVLKGDTTAIKGIEVSNNKGSTEGNMTLNVTDIYFENNESNVFLLVDDETVFYLGQNKSKEIKVQCIPPDVGEYTAKLILENNDPNSPEYSVDLICEGISPTLNVQILQSGNVLDFGVQGIDTRTNISLTIGNSGGGTLEVQVPVITDDTDNVFELDTSQFNGNTQMLKENYLTMPVYYNPQAEGTHEAKIQFETNQQNSQTFIVHLKGTAKPASLVSDKNPIEFLSQRVGTTGETEVTLTNDGEVELNIVSISIENNAFSFGTNDVLADVTLEPQDEHKITVVFKPVEKGNHNTMLHIELSDAVTSELDVLINAIGTAPVMSITERNNGEFIDVLDFGDGLLGGESERILDITNNGDANLSITGLEITENSADNEFSFDGIGMVQVPIGQTVSVRMYYKPVTWAGPDSGKFKISSDDPDAESVTITLQGRAIDPKAIYSVGSELDFGEHHYGATVTDKIEITNGGQIGTLVINEINLVNSDNEFDFYIVDETLPFELYANANPALRNKLTVRVTFTPPAKARPEPPAEVFSNGLRIESNSYLAPVDGIQITGTGTPCPDGYWDNDSNHADCEYGECFISNDNVEICDNIDNDCDGNTDNGDNVADNCTPPLHAYSICTDGACDFECEEDYHNCDGTCVDSSDINHCGESCIACPIPDFGIPTCMKVEGQYECGIVCNNGYHACGDECKSDTSPLSCGDLCVPCPEPPDGGDASCINGVCDTACDPGYYQNGTSCVLCNTSDHCGETCRDCGNDPINGSFSCSTGVCKLYCEQGFHACGSFCYDSSSVNSCGDRCTPCPSPETGGSAECNNGQCEIACVPGFYLSNDNCLLCSTPTHCGLNCIDCGTTENGSFTCLNSQCYQTCNENYHLCGEDCVSDNNAAHCGDSCQSCEERFGALPDGQWVCSDGTCQVSCEEGFHDCDGSCVSDNSPKNCGASCESCAELNGPIQHGSYICVSGQCERECNDHFVLEGTTCVPDNSIYCCGSTCETCEPGINSDPLCVDNGSFYECTTECSDNYWDLDDDGTNCEYFCEHLSDLDVPDADAIDANCDGIDGVISHSIFVSTPANGGRDLSGNGTMESPYSTIQKAILMASSCSDTPCDVLVSNGQYTQTIYLASGISVYGGYDSDTWEHNVSIQSTIQGTERVAVIATDITEPTTLQGFEIFGKDYTGSGQSTYTIWVNNSQDEKLTVEYSLIHGGIGGKGIAGAAGDNGATGSKGADSSGSSGGSKGTATCSANGGNGGSSYDCGGHDGYAGSAGEDNTGGGGGGPQGSSKCGGCDDSAGNGTKGTDGLSGEGGSAGDTASDGIGSFTDGFWENSFSGSGSRGKHGCGGGGGGSGGTDEDPLICVFWSGTEKGGGGGGGGAGGCGGLGGSGGGPGGGSFAIVLVDSTMKITDSTIFLGQGGEGGDGGKGGDGGAGKSGGSGYSPDNDEAGRGGAGGTGGDGGGGGGGAGGCGGPVVGIAKVGTSGAVTQRVYYESGSGGFGGAGGAGGKVGGTGDSAETGNTGCTGLTFISYEFAK